MAVSRDSIAILHLIWERDCYKAINNLVKNTKTAGIGSPKRMGHAMFSLVTENSVILHHSTVDTKTGIIQMEPNILNVD